jgi:hypothetical protein
MQDRRSTVRERGGLYALLALLLSLLPVASQATIVGAPNERLVVQLAESLAFEAAATATIPQAVQAPRYDADLLTGDGSSATLPAAWVTNAPAVASRDHDLPPSTAPPGSASADAYRARAPPLR